MPRPLHLALALCIGLLLGSMGTARASEADEMWSKATALVAQEDAAAAVEILAALAARYPEHKLADDALFLAGSLCEEKLANPRCALDNYRKLVKGYPDSRSTLAAEKRLERLRSSVGEDARFEAETARFQDLLQGYPSRDLDESIELAEALLAESGAWPGRPRLLLWLAETKRRAGLLSEALAHYDEALGHQSDIDVDHALLGAAELEILMGRFDAAQRRLDAMPGELSGAMKEARADLRRRLEDARARERNLLLSRIGLVLALLVLLALHGYASGGPRQALAGLWPPPAEALFLLPFALLLVLMALTGHEEVGPAVMLMSGGTLLLTWLGAAALRARSPLRPGWALACASTGVLGGLCLCYLALYRSQLLDLVITTVRFGPE